ncbi:relaxase/mobilization nuclease domain-containing protein [Sphingomicrobium sp. XHP0239]|uniref:relaxase/mobilization nuclease domain-containing protein n=1 Tax=Sphingomicrobium maritimum TaxID=3133972 RepID=UPI0031CC63BF
MIVKRIRKKAPRKRRSLDEIRTIVNVLSTYVLNASAGRVLDADGENALASYVLDTQVLAGHVIEPGEKVDLHGTRCLEGSALVGLQRQMLAANLLTPGAVDPIEHYVMSWKSHERPALKEIEDAVDIFAQEMGYQDCQIVWATHSNTKNYHLHLVVNRIDLAKQKVVSPGNGWEIDRLHQVAALIEDAQGWSPERNAIYAACCGEVRERLTGKVMRRADGSRDGCATRKKTAPEKSRNPEFETIAEALRKARSWQDLHNRLNKVNAAYREKGSGAEIVIGKVRMKASDFGREFSYGEMTKKLGEFTPDPLREKDPYEDYLAALREERSRVREALNEALEQIKARRKFLEKKARVEKETYEAVIAEARLKLCFDLAEAEVKKAFDRSRATIAANKLRREAWYEANCPDPIKVGLPEMVFSPNILRDEAIASDYGLISRHRDHTVEYRDADGSLAVTDVGVVLIIHRIERNAVAASLAMANARGDRILVAGSKEFLDICKEVAKAKGYALVRENGEMLHDPAVVDRKVISSKAANKGKSRSAAPAQEKRGKAEPKKLEENQPERSVPRKKSTHFSRFPAPARDDENDELSDAVRLAVMNGRGKGSGL